MMQVFQNPRTAQQNLKKNTVVAIGNFDGVHFGHQKLIEITLNTARKQKLIPCVLTFEPHPVRVLAQSVAPLLLNTLEQKLELIAGTGIQTVLVQKFDKKFAATAPEKFVSDLLIKNLKAQTIVVGYDFTFGKKRSGTIETLELLGQKHGIKIIIVDAQQSPTNILASSTLIRKFIAAGQVQEAITLLTRPYFIDGMVIHGHKRGRQFGIQTANIKAINELLPADGVYATFCRIGKKTISSLTNIGFNPTFGDGERSVETHILDYKGDLYGKKLRLYFMDRLRDEKKFASPQDLVAQIQKDIERGRKILENNPLSKNKIR